MNHVIARRSRSNLGVDLSCLFVAAAALMVTSAFAATVVVDDFEESSPNKAGGRSNTYVMAPSRVLHVKMTEGTHGGAKALMLKYDKKDKGGPYDSGGWCGYYILLKSGSNYFDATPYKSLNLWVKGATGEENFCVGLADRHWDDVGDSVKSEEIAKYLPAGKLTTGWQRASIPLDVFMLEHRELASLVICFEGSLFPGGAGKGTVYLDDVSFE